MRVIHKTQELYFVVQLTCEACFGIFCRLLTFGHCGIEIVFFEEDSPIQGERRVSRLRGIQGSKDELGSKD